MDASEITYEMVAKKLREIVTSRGRKGTDKHEQVGEHTQTDTITTSTSSSNSSISLLHMHPLPVPNV